MPAVRFVEQVFHWNLVQHFLDFLELIKLWCFPNPALDWNPVSASLRPCSPLREGVVSGIRYNAPNIHTLHPEVVCLQSKPAANLARKCVLLLDGMLGNH